MAEVTKTDTEHLGLNSQKMLNFRVYFKASPALDHKLKWDLFRLEMETYILEITIMVKLNEE